MNVKDLMLRRIRERAKKETEYLARQFARALPDETEAILAHLEFEKWIVEACDDAMDGSTIGRA